MKLLPFLLFHWWHFVASAADSAKNSCEAPVARTLSKWDNGVFRKETSEWLQLQADALLGINRDVEWVECIGFALMANRVRFLSSCFALALALKRPLAYRGMHHSMYEAEKRGQRPVGSDALHAEIFSAFDVPFAYPEIPPGPLPESVWEIEWTSEESRSAFACRDLRLELSKKARIRITGTFYFLPFLLSNAYFSDYFDALAPRKNAISLITKYIFRPSERVLQRKRQVERELGLHNASYVIGLQVRDGDSQQKGYSKPQPTGWVSDAEIAEAGRLVSAVVPRYLLADSIYFVASDTDLGLAKAKRGLGEGRVRSGRNAKSGDILEAVVDIIILAQSDVLILSYWSSFGELAWVLGEHQDVFVVTDVGPGAAAPSCGNVNAVNFGDVRLIASAVASRTISLRVHGPPTFSCAEYSTFARRLSCFEERMVGGQFSNLGESPFLISD